MRKLTRRKALAGMGGVVVGGAGTAGCQHPVQPINLADAGLTDPKAPLTIDVHTHVFNGEDIQVERFFEDVIALDSPALKVFGPLLKQLGSFAPKMQAELDALKSISAASAFGNTGAAASTTAGLAEDRYQTARKQIAAANEAVKARRVAAAMAPAAPVPGAAPPPPAAAFDALELKVDALPKTYTGYRQARRAAALAPAAPAFPAAASPGGAVASPALGVTVDGGLAFLLRNFQYRYVNVHDYLVEYSTGNARKVDLMVTHLVDYDWPLGQLSTPTPLADQVALMEHIARLTQGWVHCFVPFCPFKQVAFWRGLTKDDPMALVQDAVLKRGHIGVKMYPPMGFRPFDNAAQPANFWAGTPLRRPLGDPAPGPTLGEDLDAALGVLYAWCLANDVPIMAHTSPSNNPAKKYKPDVTAPRHWVKVLKAFPGLRVNFGHFGNTDFVFDKGQNASQLMALMTPGAGSPGGKLYADSAFFSEILSSPATMESQLRQRLAESTGRQDAALSQRLMYGTDWEMVTIEGGTTTGYLDRFESVFDHLAKDPALNPNGDLANRFFGINAANYLGLNEGQATRERLKAFHGTVRPAWMAKVDRIGKPQA